MRCQTVLRPLGTPRAHRPGRPVAPRALVRHVPPRATGPSHRAATTFSYFSYNFCWPVRTLRVRGEHGRWQKRTPAMAAGQTDHVWSLNEWLAYPVVQSK